VRYYHLFYLFAALAVLAKGLIGIVLPGGVIFWYILLTRRWNLLREMRLVTGIMLFLLVCAPWFIMVSIRNPEFARFFFIHEHFERFLTKVHGRYQPPWYFIPILIGVMLPWSFFIPTALARIWQERKQEGADIRLFLFLWAAIIFVFFSISDSKLIPYILPVYPAVALLIGTTCAAALDRGFSSLKPSALVLSAVTIVLGIGCIAYPHVARDPKITAVGGMITGGLLLALGVIALLNTIKNNIASLFAGLAITALLVGIFAPPTIYARMVKERSSRELALLVKEKADKNAIVSVYDYEQALPFYTQRRVVVIGDRNELEFGSRQGEQSAWFIDAASFPLLWAGPAQVFTLINLRDIEIFDKICNPPLIILGKSGSRALITNR
jgi:4-amino-4-deoxy-L-arabinose transferase-like glycosyltransferase